MRIYIPEKECYSPRLQGQGEYHPTVLDLHYSTECMFDFIPFFSKSADVQ